MMPIAPDLVVRQLEQDDAPALQAILNPLLTTARYSQAMTVEMIMAQILRQHPHTVFPIRLQHNQVLGVWRARRLVGCVDVAVGLDSETLDRPDYLPFGILRMFVLPERSDLVNEVAALMMEAAEDYWREAKIGHIKAFHLSTGYPAFQAGVGLLPGDWDEHFRVLTANGYQLADRYFCVHRLLHEPIEEFVSLAELSLVYRGSADDRRYELYRRSERIGEARMVRSELTQDGIAYPAALIAALYVDPHWRQHDLGKWLVARMINDSTLRGCRELVAYVTLAQNAAMNLLVQQGFEERHYRGYVLEKTLIR
jgi:GNAT superfamily N-acetyltransferase